MPGSSEARVRAALETVIIFTERMELLAAFYQQALDLGPFERSPQHMGQAVGPIYLGFDQVDALEGEASPRVSLWFTVDDLQAAFDRLVALGAGVRYPPTQKPWGGHLASVYDPDGNLLGLSQRQRS
jgi:predicted enzyme related to lactoylglutathione lyase